MTIRSPRLRKPTPQRPTVALPRPIQPGLWGKDHWTTLGYLETRCVDHGGRLLRDHMRTDTRRHPLLVGDTQRRVDFGPEKYPTRLFGGAALPDHDDWDCLEDLEAAGLITIDRRTYPQGHLAVPPGARGKIGGDIHRKWNPMVALTELGARVSGLLRAHKAAGGNFIEFVWTPAPGDCAKSS